MQLVENFKFPNLPEFRLTAGLPAGLPAVRPTNTKSITPDFSHNSPIYETVVLMDRSFTATKSKETRKKILAQGSTKDSGTR